MDSPRRRPCGRRQHHRRIQPGRHDADDVAPFIHQRPAGIGRLHRHADLKVARLIRRAGQRGDFPLGQLGREPLETDVGKTGPPDFGHGSRSIRTQN